MKWGRGFAAVVTTLASLLVAIAAEAQTRPTLSRAPDPSARVRPDRPGGPSLGLPPDIQGLQVGFSKVFVPDVIGPGSVTTLRFDIESTVQDPVTDLAFTDSLPAGMTIASVPSAISGCGGTLSAPAGGTTISFSDGSMPAGTTCSISVDVTSATPGVSTNVSGDLTSSEGNSGSATADLTVDVTRPGFSKSFSPSSVSLGSRSTLTLVIDNSANPSDAFNMSFVDTLPSGMTIADPANPSTDCSGGQIIAVPGSSVLSYSFLFLSDNSVSAGESCSVSADVVGGAGGVLGNVSGSLVTGATQFVSDRDSGKASAPLEVVADPLVVTKSFTDDPVIPGEMVTLEFTVLNRDRDFAATGIEFDDNLDATLTGLIATGLPMNDVCGAGSMLTGVSTINLTGGNLSAEGLCTFSLTLQVPALAPPGVYPNTTSSITGSIDGLPVVGAPAFDSLTVNTVPTLTKTFLTNPVGSGAAVDVEFTLLNPSTSSTATDVGFTDNIGAFISGTTVTSLPAAGFCGAGSIAFVPDPDNPILNIANANLAPSASCTFTVGLQLPLGTPSGEYVNTTSPVSATIDGVTVLGSTATDTLVVVPGPTLSKTFTDDPVAAGDTVTLEFTVALTEASPSDATEIGFTDDLAAALSGLVAVGLPLNDICGSGSSLTGTSTLTFAGGTLSPATSCTFSVTLQTPASALPGNYTNTTSDVTATVEDVPTLSRPASDDLTISGLALTKEFTDDPVVAGTAATLEFTIDNTTAGSDATNIFFTDDLNNTLSGLVATGLPMNDVCGAGSQISGTSTLIFVGGSVAAGESCTFSVSVVVPIGTADGGYLNVTSNLVAELEGQAVVLDPARDVLDVDSNLLLFTKEFTDDPVLPGAQVTLEFSLTNQDADEAITGITFTDDLDDALSGLAATGLPAADVCGAGSQIAGTSLLTLTGATLPAGGACTFSVTLDVPASVPAGTLATNVTSEVSGLIGGQQDSLGGTVVTGAPATDELIVTFLTFDKSFANPAFPGETTTLTFTLQNEDPGNGFAQLDFSDDLDSVISGLVATGLPLSDICGSGSVISGTSFLTFTGGNLGPGASCTFDVEVLVPADATPGSHPNITSELTQNGLALSEPATDDLVIEAQPNFTKLFAPNPIEVGVPSTLTFTIDNSASTVDATALDFTDMLPAGVFVSTPPNPATTCVGGTLTAAAGSGVISYTSGSVSGGASCTVEARVTSLDAGVYVNTTGDLTSSSGNSGPATDTLTVNRTVSIAVTKTDNVTSAAPGDPLTYILTVANGGPSADPAVGFVDNFPVELEGCSYVSVAVGGATGNSSGSGDIGDTLSMPAGSSVGYTVDCTIAGDASGTLVNTAVATPSGMDSDPSDDSATDDNTVLSPIADLSLTLEVVYDPAVAATVQVYDLTVENAGPSTATNTSLDQELPVGSYFLGAEPSSVNCSLSSGIALSCNLGDVAMGDVVTVSVGAYIDARFDGTLSTEALVGSDADDPDESDNEQDAATPVARPRSMIATTRADGTEVLAMVAKEADGTIGLVIAEAAGGGNRDYSVTGQGFRTVALAEVPDFDDTMAPEIAALATGFGGATLVDVIDADSTLLLGSHPVPGNWLPIDVVALDDFDGTTAPELALLLQSLDDQLPHVVILDAGSGAVLRDHTILGGKGLGAFPIDMSPVESFTGSPVDELAVLTQDPEFEDSVVTLLEPESGSVPNVKFLDAKAFPIAVEGLEDLDGMFGDQMGGGPEVAVLLRDVTTGSPNVEIFDAANGASFPTLSYDGSILPEVLSGVPNFAGGGASELAVGGRRAISLAVETRDAATGMVVGTIAIAGGPPLDLDLAVHPSFAGAADPEMSVLFERFDTPTEVSVFDASGGAPLFNFILP